MKYILFYFIAAIRTTATFHARLAGGRDLQLSITSHCGLLLHQGHERCVLTRTDRFM